MPSSRKVILVTGANIGLGYHCCLALAKQDNVHVIVAGRSPKRIDAAVAEISAVAAPTSIVERGIVDLSSLKSVRRFADEVKERDLQIFTLVCNAGLQAQATVLTEDGFESTIGVNHIGHFLLIKLLKDCTSRVVMMSSETHDPAEKTGAPLPDVSDLDQMARGYAKFNSGVAYSTSKLCNLLVAKEFVRRYPDGPEIIAYTPGFTPDTAFFRDMKLVFSVLKYVIMAFMWCNGGRSSTSEYSGGFMARLASEDSLLKNGWKSGDYIRVDEVYPASVQACDPVLGKALWDKSEQWVGAFTK